MIHTCTCPDDIKHMFPDVIVMRACILVLLNVERPSRRLITYVLVIMCVSCRCHTRVPILTASELTFDDVYPAVGMLYLSGQSTV